MDWILAVVAIAVVVTFAILLGIPVVIAVLRVARRRSIEKRSPLSRAEARVVDKRTELAGGRAEDQRYYVTFEFPTGNRLELEVPGRESGVLVVGDQGTVAWQGPRYLGFAREVLR
ncbi:MAG TPA: DUF2500 domain-containing protein [Propionicimonas sp.]|jgi:hypothetical protein